MLKDEDLRGSDKTTIDVILYGQRYRDLWCTVLPRDRSWIKGEESFMENISAICGNRYARESIPLFSPGGKFLTLQSTALLLCAR